MKQEYPYDLNVNYVSLLQAKIDNTFPSFIIHFHKVLLFHLVILSSLISLSYLRFFYKI